VFAKCSKNVCPQFLCLLFFVPACNFIEGKDLVWLIICLHQSNKIKMKSFFAAVIRSGSLRVQMAHRPVDLEIILPWIALHRRNCKWCLILLVYINVTSQLYTGVYRPIVRDRDTAYRIYIHRKPLAYYHLIMILLLATTTRCPQILNLLLLNQALKNLEKWLLLDLKETSEIKRFGMVLQIINRGISLNFGHREVATEEIDHYIQVRNTTTE